MPYVKNIFGFWGFSSTFLFKCLDINQEKYKIFKIVLDKHSKLFFDRNLSIFCFDL